MSILLYFLLFPDGFFSLQGLKLIAQTFGEETGAKHTQLTIKNNYKGAGDAASVFLLSSASLCYALPSSLLWLHFSVSYSQSPLAPQYIT